ncbi:hypothetical protein GLAREA_03669 [Glarea lozoyensis ATCC 20868]|uniref:Uncharacterized protein n=1 Tax=Glarea lozoyensis (strain ATCC 20868 / MF5171) TaxID=1116229 RepID=S3CWE6_GLAL2|nr:uncharacterized protein GLAREA_03669 [Glarea lozoyensis ATCC 20868]EPE30702.1 hypothetical protein GLAREA_03669 [Glarea lozoyensis ATCC 20868]
MYFISKAIHVLLGVSIGCTYFDVVSAESEYETPVQTLQRIGGMVPWDIPGTVFDNLVNNHPNATGNFPIAGPNLSMSSNSNIEGWHWSISAVADIPIVNSSWNRPERSIFYTGGKLIFNGPSSPSNQNISVNDDWHICLFNWQLDNVPYPSALRGDDGTCSSVLNNQCIAELKNAVQTSSGRSCSCPRKSEIPSCTALGNDSAIWTNTCAGGFFDATAIRRWAGGRLEKNAWGGNKAHSAGNTTAYNYIGSLAWPVMAGFYFRNQSVATTVSCPRAKDATPGSTAPTGEGLQHGEHNESAGNGESGSSIANHPTILCRKGSEVNLDMVLLKNINITLAFNIRFDEQSITCERSNTRVNILKARAGGRKHGLSGSTWGHYRQLTSPVSRQYHTIITMTRLNACSLLPRKITEQSATSSNNVVDTEDDKESNHEAFNFKGEAQAATQNVRVEGKFSNFRPIIKAQIAMMPEEMQMRNILQKSTQLAERIFLLLFCRNYKSGRSREENRRYFDVHPQRRAADEWCCYIFFFKSISALYGAE